MKPPNYSGSISKFRTNRKSGFLAGYAYVASYLPMPTFSIPAPGGPGRQPRVVGGGGPEGHDRLKFDRKQDAVPERPRDGVPSGGVLSGREEPRSDWVVREKIEPAEKHAQKKRRGSGPRPRLPERLLVYGSGT